MLVFSWLLFPLIMSSQAYVNRFKNHQNTPMTPSLLIERRPRDATSFNNGDRLFMSLQDERPEDITQRDDKVALDLRSAYVSLGVLLFTFMCNQWCRQSLYYLIDFQNADSFLHINAGLGFNQEQYGILASVLFTAVFGFTSLFVGVVSDRFDRNIVTALSCTVWSIATLLQGWATSFNDLIPLRAIIGMSQAFYNPAAYTLLSDLFPKNLIGRANGILSGGIYLGGGLASLSILVDQSLGWRSTLIAIGSVGLLAAIACLTLVRETRVIPSQPLINTAADISADSVASTINSSSSFISGGLASLKAVFDSQDARLLFLATAVRFCAGFSIGIWKAPFVFAKFPEDISSFAGSNALIVSAGGLASSLLGGYLSDAVAKPVDPKKRPRSRVWVPAVGSILAVPIWIAFMSATTLPQTLSTLLLEYLVAECWFSPTVSTLFEVVPRGTKGTAQGVLSLLTAVGNIGPYLIGALCSGSLGTYLLSDVLLWAVAGAYAISGVLFAVVAMRDDNRLEADWLRTPTD